MAVSPSAFEFLRRHVREHSAIVLDETKLYLVELRLQPLLAEAGLPHLDALAAAVRAEPRGALAQQVVEAMCTNETSFFRDRLSFDALQRSVLPRLIAARLEERTLRIWCGACSSGQEPYSVAMTLAEHFPELGSWNVELLGTDLSGAMIERARAGVFTQFEVGRGLPSIALVKHFEACGSDWRVRDSVRRRVQFRQLNLARTFALAPGYDLVFLRNVLIYFDQEARRRVLERVRRVLQPAGYLFLGAAESAASVELGLERIEYGGAPCFRAQASRAA